MDNAGPDRPAQAYLGLCCTLTETAEHVDEQKMPRLDCIEAHADLDLVQNAYKGRFLPCTSYINMLKRKGYRTPENVPSDMYAH